MPPDPTPRRAGTIRRNDEAPAARETAQSRAEQIARSFAADILDGSRPVGGMLPSEPDIAAARDCTLATARTALRHLEALGLIARGRGEAARIVASDVRTRYALAAEIDGAAGDYAASTRLLIERQRQVTGDLELALLLGTPAKATWLRLSGVRQATNAVFGPLSCVDIWLATRATALALPDAITPAALETLLGVVIAEVEEEVAAGALTPAQARHLGARGGAASLSVLRRYRRRGGAVVAAMRDIHPAERVGVLVRLRRT